MADYYVDPSIAADTGAGTVGDPYGDLQYALDNITQDATNGDRINIKSGTAEVLAAALDLSTYGTPFATYPLTLQGYATAQGDADFEAGTGIGAIDCNGAARLFSSTALDGVYLIELEVYNATGNMFDVSRGAVVRCELHTTDVAILHSGSTGHGHYEGNHIHNCSGKCIHVPTAINDVFIDNFIQTGSGAKEFTYGIFCGNESQLIQGNIIHIEAGHAATAVAIYASGGVIRCNSVLGEHSGSGHAIEITTTGNPGGLLVEGNLVDGWGSSGTGIGGDEVTGVLAYNYVSQATTKYDVREVFGVDNEEAESTSPFAKTGDATFANRATYFAPTDDGNIIGGLPHGRNKGAIHRSS